MSGNNVAAADLFLELSAFWRPPDAEFWQGLADGTVDAEIAKQSQQAELSTPMQGHDSFSGLLPPLASLQYFFVRCFIGIGKKSVLPVESVYKKWTEDPTARLPIAGSTGYLMGDAALHAKYLLEHYGLDVPPDYRMMPDHLVILLELAAFLLQNRTDEESRLFLSQHLDWLDRFSQAVTETETENEQDHQAKRFYQLALQTLQQTVDCQLMKYSGSKY